MFKKLVIAAVLTAALACLPAPAQTTEAAGYNPFPFGSCTWLAAQMRPDIADSVWGNALNWTYAARMSGRNTGYAPSAGAIAVFQPGVQGAWGDGHVAYVTAIGRNGWFQVEEMDYPVWGRISYRWAHSGWGVSFIY